jgi:signal transduction histidine kinase
MGLLTAADPQALGMDKHMGPTSKQAIRGRILIVDDENGPRQALRMLLKEDHEVHLAEDVAKAQEILQSESIDLVITDLRMPRKSGVELLRWTKTQYPETEVIILTGFGELDSAMNAVEYGALAYIVKPFDTKVMLRHVEEGLNKREKEMERRRMEELAMEANRFETLGRFVSGMLHDLGTPLAVITGQLEMILNRPQVVPTPDRLHMMHSQIGLCTDIVRSAMNFLRHETQRFAILNINDVAETCLTVSMPLLQKMAVKVKRDLGQQVPLCEGDFVLMRQAVLNLITNACQAMDGQAPPREIHIRTWRDEDNVCISVSDTGPGVPIENRSKIFDTFYSTKGKNGTGLGLAAVKNIMRRHNGEVILEINEWNGAEFTLKFPILK